MRVKRPARPPMWGPGRPIYNENTAFNSNYHLPGLHTFPFDDDLVHAEASSHRDSDPTPLAERRLSGGGLGWSDGVEEPIGMSVPSPYLPESTEYSACSAERDAADLPDPRHLVDPQSLLPTAAATVSAPLHDIAPVVHAEQPTSTHPEARSSNVWEIDPGDLTPAGKHRRATEVADAFTDKYSRADSNLFDAASVVNSESATFMISKKNGDSFEQRSNVFLSADGLTAAVTALYKAAQQHELRAKPEQSERKRKRDDTADERRDLEAIDTALSTATAAPVIPVPSTPTAAPVAPSPLTIIKLKVSGLASSSSASAVATSASHSPAASAQTAAVLESCNDLTRMVDRMQQLVRHLCDKKPAYPAQIDQATRSGIHANLTALSNLYGLDS